MLNPVRRDGRFIGVCLILFLPLAAAASLHMPDEPLGGDAPQYIALAENVADHAAFSLGTHEPYLPSVHRTPGYPAFLAVLGLTVGDSIVAVRLAQFALLAGTGLLVYFLGLGLGGRKVARLSAVFCLGYLPFIWLARFHLSEVLATFLVTAVVILLVRLRDSRAQRPVGAIGTGAVLALAVLVRPSLAFTVVPVALLVILAPGRENWKTSSLNAGLVVAGFLLVTAPWALRNIDVTERPLPFGAGSGVSLYASSQQYRGELSYKLTPQDWDKFLPRARVETRRRTGKLIIPGVRSRAEDEVLADDAMKEAARDSFRDVGFFDALRQMPKRIGYLWAVADYPPAGITTIAHRIGQLQHLLLLVLAVGGTWIAARLPERRAYLWPLLVFSIYLSALHVVFHVEARYTVPARAALIPLAALAAVSSYDRFQARRPPPTTAC